MQDSSNSINNALWCYIKISYLIDLPNIFLKILLIKKPIIFFYYFDFNFLFYEAIINTIKIRIKVQRSPSTRPIIKLKTPFLEDNGTNIKFWIMAKWIVIKVKNNIKYTKK